MNITLDRVVPCAVFQANEQLRACRRGDWDHATQIHTRFYDTIASSAYPHTALRMVARRLGRQRSTQVGIENWVIESACRQSA